jgi:poly(A) polymerase
LTADPLEIAEAVLSDEAAWVVGGAVRDRLLGRPTVDLDLAVAGDAEPRARAIARATHSPAFPLSESFGAWRVVARDRSWQVDLTPLTADTIEDDLRQRDFTINAMALPVGSPAAGAPAPLDPTGGLADLRARRMRMVSEAALAADPLRAVRLARFACELDFDVDGETAECARRNAPGLANVAAERIFAELRSIVRCPRAGAGLRLIEELGVTAIVAPELLALRGVEQSDYHHLDVYEHTLAVLDALVDLERDPAALGAHAEAAAAELARPLADEMTRGQALRLGALLHDIAKPQTRAIGASGRVSFMGHDRQGAGEAHAIIRRLRGSEALASFVAGVTRNHLRAGFLVHRTPLSRREVFAYLEACSPVEVEVTVLSVADRLATRGRKSEEAIAKHLAVAGDLLGEALAWRAGGRPEPLVRGDELAAELEIEAGPELGRLLHELEVASFAGEIATRADALAHARDFLARGLGG